MMKPMGIKNLPDNVFKKPAYDSNTDGSFYTHWMETEKSKQDLQYQRKKLQDYKKDVRKPPFVQKTFVKLFSPIIKRSLIKKSPYKT